MGSCGRCARAIWVPSPGVSRNLERTTVIGDRSPQAKTTEGASLPIRAMCA